MAYFQSVCCEFSAQLCNLSVVDSANVFLGDIYKQLWTLNVGPEELLNTPKQCSLDRFRDSLVKDFRKIQDGEILYQNLYKMMV